MPTGIGLMGLGRIGKNIFRILHTNEDLRIKAVSDVVDPTALAYMLRFDTLLGRFPDEVVLADGSLHVAGREVKVVTEPKGSTAVPSWGELGVDVVIEATGKTRTRADLERHFAAGAKRVILCSPSEAPDATVVFGINEDGLRPEHRIVSVSSATVNAVGPVLKVLAGAFGIERAFLTTVHAFTGHQKLADVPDGDARRGRAAGENIIPQQTHAAELLIDVLPELKGKITGYSMNVPVADGSAADLVCWHQKPVTVEAVNEAVRAAIAGDGLKGVLGYETDPIVSSDILHLETSGRYDSLATMVLGSNASKTLTWFDNGWGYAHRVVDLLRRFERFESEKGAAQ
ncbi:MAG TPA: glyceraldehyde 3-phosphate dehydrogenase NAD-binding domain-containing protein [Thermoanaerobaculia bacterium]